MPVASSQANKYIVVGAGVAGVSAALLLAREEPSAVIEIWEATAEVGGLLAPVAFHGIDCDRGSHRIHPQADPLLLSLTEAQQWLRRPRQGALILNQRHIQYPPQPVDFLRGLGVRTSAQMGLGFALRPRSFRRFLSWEQDRSELDQDDRGFESFVIERVGEAAYNKFYRPYVEKVWGLPPAELSQSVAKQRISTSAPWQTLLGKLRGQSHRRSGAFFLYPQHGMTGLIRHLRDLAEAAGVTFHFSRPVGQDELRKLDATAVLFSGHLSHLAPMCQLDHRGLYLLHVLLPAGSVEERDTFYSPEGDYWFGRVSRPDYFSPSLQIPGCELLCLEIPEGRWGTEQQFEQKLPTLMTQLRDAGIVRRGSQPIDCLQTFLPRVYPMYTRGWLERWRRALEEVKSFERIYPIGRQGLFLHCNVDHCVRISHEAVSAIVAGHTASRWISRASQFLDLRVRD